MARLWGALLMVVLVQSTIRATSAASILPITTDGRTSRNADGEVVADKIICDHFDAHQCGLDPDKCTIKQKQCVAKPLKSSTKPACFTVWKNNSDGVKLQTQGCWPYDKDATPECMSRRCVSRSSDKKSRVQQGVHFCCCIGQDSCNKEYHGPSPTTDVDGSEKAGTPTPDAINATGARDKMEESSLMDIMMIFLPICLMATLIFLAYWLWRCYRARSVEKKSPLTGDTTTMGLLPRSEKPQQPIQLERLLSRGRFGAVWKGTLADVGGRPAMDVAVKVFPPEDADSWLSEQEIYATAEMRNQGHILKFICAERRTTMAAAIATATTATDSGALDGVYGPAVVQYWLVTSYQQNGCLCDFLKANTLGLNQTLHIAVGILDGLAFLHSEKVRDGKVLKPTVVHRDLKSRNILLDANLNPCIGDFGLAMVCENGRSLAETHEQVGTHRYMAPEVLELATEFSALAFRQIDVYACALILWEILTRTRRTRDETVADFKLPYEEDVGMQPTLADMHECVVRKKRRPKIPSYWNTEPKAYELVHTMEDMWDTEPEARISAGCAWERLTSVGSVASSLPPPPPSRSSTTATGSAFEPLTVSSTVNDHRTEIYPLLTPDSSQPNIV